MQRFAALLFAFWGLSAVAQGALGCDDAFSFTARNAAGHEVAFRATMAGPGDASGTFRILVTQSGINPLGIFTLDFRHYSSAARANDKAQVTLSRGGALNEHLHLGRDFLIHRYGKNRETTLAYRLSSADVRGDFVDWVVCKNAETIYSYERP